MPPDTDDHRMDALEEARDIAIQIHIRREELLHRLEHQHADLLRRHETFVEGLVRDRLRLILLLKVIFLGLVAALGFLFWVDWPLF